MTKLSQQIEVLKANGIKVIGTKDRLSMVIVRREDLEKASALKIDGVTIVSMA